MGKTCFVIMPIGEQCLRTGTVSSIELHARYNDLIKEALLRARPNLEVVRSDEVTSPGGITTDIFTRLMHSDYVLVDITYPNPNVFYELGIRHACRTGTILIRDKGAAQSPFDIAALRHIQYDNTPTGLKVLAEELKNRFDWLDTHPIDPDNEFLSLAKLTAYAFPSYSERRQEAAEAVMFDAFSAIIKVPELVQLLAAQASEGTAVPPQELITKMAAYPDVLQKLLLAFIKTGKLTF